ncbi:hypothetical protein BC829DRAFT_386698 [Chytridium lagenaria]|nr:hypothetical protein BC829DRAFT_386698 [Chytridium lagenaria]
MHPQSSGGQGGPSTASMREPELDRKIQQVEGNLKETIGLLDEQLLQTKAKGDQLAKMEAQMKTMKESTDVFRATAKPKQVEVEKKKWMGIVPVRLKAPERTAIPRGSLEESQRLIGEKLRSRQKKIPLLHPYTIITLILLLIILATASFVILNFVIKHPKPDTKPESRPSRFDVQDKVQPATPKVNTVNPVRHPSLFYDYLKEKKG